MLRERRRASERIGDPSRRPGRRDGAGARADPSTSRASRHEADRSASPHPSSPAVARGRADDPLPSWNDGPAKRAIVAFVERVTKEGGPDFVPAAERIATFDNDGTLWSEQPDLRPGRLRPRPHQGPGRRRTPSGGTSRCSRPRSRATSRRSWPGTPRDRLELARRQPRRDDDRGVRADRRGLAGDGEAPAVRPAVHRAGLPADAGAARLPAGQRLQDLHRLRRRRRVHAALGRAGLRHPARAGDRQHHQGRSTSCATAGRSLVRLPEIEFIDDRAGKPVGIQRAIGRRPIAAFGNSDGDYEMLRWTTAGPGPAARPDRPPHRRGPRVGLRPRVARRPARPGARRGPANGWVVVDMKADWKNGLRVRGVSYRSLERTRHRGVHSWYRPLGRCPARLAATPRASSPPTGTKRDTVALHPAPLAERTQRRRAVEAVIWGMPAVNYDLLYEALVKAGGNLQPGRLLVAAAGLEEPDAHPEPRRDLLLPFFQHAGRRARRARDSTCRRRFYHGLGHGRLAVRTGRCRTGGGG